MLNLFIVLACIFCVASLIFLYLLFQEKMKVADRDKIIADSKTEMRHLKRNLTVMMRHHD